MLNHYQQLLKQFNTRKQKPRYKAKRERRNYLTEAFIDGELALYKPAHVPYRIFTDKIKEWKGNEVIMPKDYPAEVVIHSPIYSPPAHLNWFEKLLLWIRKIFKRV